ncbi:MAG: class I SAM-dependent methyltransferase [Anaerolineae bacterium]
MPGEYAVLASIYDEIGMSDLVNRLTPRLIDYAQRIDWLGRRIVVLGCGTGASIAYLSQYPYTITGVDNSPEMLEVARDKIDTPDHSIKWLQLDIRDLGNQIPTADLVLALNVFNELSSLRDLEAVFANAQRVLEPGKLFIFDMLTLQGLAEAGTQGVEIIFNDPKSLNVFSSNDYDYERQVQTTDYIIYRQRNGNWVRSESKLIRRAFPVQAVSSLAQRNNFNIRTIMNANLEEIEVGTARTQRVIFFAEKSST